MYNNYYLCWSIGKTLRPTLITNCSWYSQQQLMLCYAMGSKLFKIILISLKKSEIMIETENF